MQTVIIRPSSLKDSERCPGYARASIGKRDTSNHNTIPGTLAHKWLEDALVYSPDVADANWPKHVKRIAGDKDLAEDPAITLKNVHLFYEYLMSVDLGVDFSSEDAHCEDKLEKKYVFKDVTAIIPGTSDFVFVTDEHVIVIDWKYYRDTSYLDSPDKNIQILAYGLMAAEKYGCKSVTVALGLIRQREILTHHFSPEELRERARWLERRVKRIAENYGECNPSPACTTCLVAANCPEFVKQSFMIAHDLHPWSEDDILDETQAIRLAKGLKPAEKLLKMAKAKVKEYCNNFGELVDGGYRYATASFNKRYVRDTAKAMKFLSSKANKSGVDIRDYCSLSVEKAEKFLIECGHNGSVVEDIMKKMDDKGFIGRMAVNYYKWKRA